MMRGSTKEEYFVCLRMAFCAKKIRVYETPHSPVSFICGQNTLYRTDKHRVVQPPGCYSSPAWGLCCVHNVCHNVHTLVLS